MCVRRASFDPRGVMLLAALGLAGCASPRSPGSAYAEPADAPRWPPSPAEARVRYVGEAHRPSDLGARTPLALRVLNGLSGGDRGDEPWLRPCGLAVDERGNPCLTDADGAAAGFFDRAAGRFHRWTGIAGQPFLQPVAIAKRGEWIGVADSALGRVFVFDVRGRPRFTLAAPLQRPAALAWSGDRLVVADSATHLLHVYDTEGRHQMSVGGRGEAVGSFNFPTHLAAAPDGGVLVTDALNFRIQRLSAALEPSGAWGRAGQGGGSLCRPKGVAVTASGVVLVVDALFDNIQFFDAAGRFLMHVGDHGTGPAGFSLPAGIAVSADGWVYVADSGHHRVQIFRLEDAP